MELLTLENCLDGGLFTRRIYNRLHKIEDRLKEKGIYSLPEFLYREYHENEMTLKAITQELDELTQLTTSHGRLREYMSALNIPILSRSEALTGKRNSNYGNRGESNPLTGTHISEERKRRQSEKQIGRKNPCTASKEGRERMGSFIRGKTWEEVWGEERARERKEKLRMRQSGENSHFYGKYGSQASGFGKSTPIGLSSSLGGYRKDIGHFVRSTWEANIARVFMVMGEKYLYEPQRFVLDITEDYRYLFPKADKTTYLPDFENGHYYEVKGSFDMEGGILSFAKFLMFIEQYQVHLEIIDAPVYHKLEEEFAQAVNSDKRLCGWETLTDNIKTKPSKYR